MREFCRVVELLFLRRDVYLLACDAVHLYHWIPASGGTCCLCLQGGPRIQYVYYPSPFASLFILNFYLSFLICCRFSFLFHQSVLLPLFSRVFFRSFLILCLALFISCFRQRFAQWECVYCIFLNI